ncbi:MAG: DUF308 domain-containing protein [Gammaproteobacteria bacterium]|nr:DUF308 domain-containing protein [Gammaproteobacteria bacterium]
MALEKEQLQAAAAGARGRISDKLGDVWWTLLVRGLLAVALGLAALFWPIATLALLVRLIGLYVLFDGILSLLATFRAKEFGAYLVSGLISVAIGLILLFWPDVTGRLLMIIVGLWALFHGVVLFLAGRQTDPNDPDRGLTITIGAVAAIVGLVLVIWPATGVVTISWTIAIAALLLGGLLIFLAMRIKSVEKRVDDLGRPS